MKLLIGLIHYTLVALFGIVLSADFSGASKQKKSLVKLAGFSVFILILQFACWKTLGIELTFQIYPFITHIPLTIFLVTVFRRSWLISAISVMSAYMCCQIPKWIADIAYLFSDEKVYQHLLYMFSVLATYALLRRYAVEPTRKLLTRSTQSALVVGVMPLLYYIFDYITTVYTDLLYSGHPFAVQFMPSIMASFYFFFLLVYYSRLEAQEKSQRERDLLTLQLRRSEAEFAAMRQMQEQTRQYRHDLRHHFSFLLELAETGDLSKIKDYLHNTQENLDTFTPKRFCGNDVVDLMLSCFAGRAESAGVKLSVDAKLPAALPFEDTELCSLLSNGLENAIIAAGKIADPAQRTIFVRLGIRQKNLLLSIQNPFTGKVIFTDGLPVTDRKEHGFGTRSIVSIVNNCGGQVSFLTKDNIFLLRVILPLND